MKRADFLTNPHGQNVRMNGLRREQFVITDGSKASIGRLVSIAITALVIAGALA
jgi:hypothetical protein